MAQVISIEDALSARTKPGPYFPGVHVAEFGRVRPFVSSQQSVTKENVYRAILLLDLAAQHARLLVKAISDPSRTRNLEAQIAGIEELIQHARDLALKL
jgi:hypothetical protein